MYTGTLDSKPSWPVWSQTGLVDLIGSVGRSTFGEVILRTLREATGCTQIVIFAGPKGEQPQTVLMQGINEVPRWRNEKYLRKHWRVDPIRGVEEHNYKDRQLVLVDTGDLHSQEYREDCFDGVNLQTRATICDPVDDHLVRLNLYFTDRRAFDTGVGEYLNEVAPVLCALLRRHGIQRYEQVRPMEKEHVVERLSVVAPKLTARESEVCSHISRGVTSEGIALELGISINTVLTYRKRAYARLNISTQAELVRLVTQ